MHWKKRLSYACEVCNEFIPGDNWVSHLINEHCGSCFYQCPYCIYRGYKREDLFRHLHAKHRHFKLSSSCPLCSNFIAQNEFQIESHIQNNHFYEVNIFMCNYCNYSTPDKVQINDHIYIKHYVCLIRPCNYVCNDPYQLFSHYYFYHFPFLVWNITCTKCSRMFKKKESLNQHLRDSHNIYDDPTEYHGNPVVEITCRRCSDEFQDREDYYDHMDNCPDVFYSCPFKKCLYESDRFWSLTQHFIDKHLSNNVFYYICTHCEYRSTQDYSLRKHLYKNHGIESYCILCYSYLTTEDLVDHLYDEHDYFEKYIWCRLCPEEYTDIYDLDYHLYKEHGIFIPPTLRLLC